MSSFDLHQRLLSDAGRLRALGRALRETVRPGAVVVDLGSGTGILGFLALRAGAGRVYAIERHPIIRLARAIARDNGFEDRIRFVAGDSRRVRLPEPADLVVSDLAGPLGIDPDMAGSLADARRFLKARGRMMPERTEVWISPVDAAALYRRHVQAGKGHGVRLDALHAIAANRLGVFRGIPRKLSAPPRRALVFDSARSPAAFPRRARLGFRVEGGWIHGMAILVRVRLSRSVTLDASSGAHLRPLFLPLRHPLRTRAGERVGAELVVHDATHVEWSLGGQRHSTLFERMAYA